MRWLNVLFDLLLGWLLRALHVKVRSELTSRGLVIYLKTVEKIRTAAIGLIAFFVILQAMTIGFFLTVATAVYLLPWAVEDKVLVILGLGATLFLLPLIGLIVFLSSRVWYKASGAEKALNEIKRAS